MTGPKLEALTLDKLITRFHEVEAENERLLALIAKMEPVVASACILNLKAMRDNHIVWGQLEKNIKALAEHRGDGPSGNPGELEPA